MIYVMVGCPPSSALFLLMVPGHVPLQSHSAIAAALPGKSDWAIGKSPTQNPLHANFGF
jgi:hypothetical protein